jgi:hypothetical protein
MQAKFTSLNTLQFRLYELASRLRLLGLVHYRMPSSGMLRHVALVRPDVSEEHSASIITVEITGEMRTLAVTSNRS